MMAAGVVMKKFTLNLSLMLHPCELVAAIVVSEMNERLSPKKAPPTTTAVSRAAGEPVDCASPAAMGTSATIVPTLVPMDSEMKQVARKSPGRSILSGNSDSIKSTVASTEPMALADWAKAPASMKIHSMSMMLLLLAPLLKMSTLWRSPFL